MVTALSQQFEQERLEIVIRAVDLVDQQHGRPRARMLERPQQRPTDQIVRREQVVVGDESPAASASRIASSWRG